MLGFDISRSATPCRKPPEAAIQHDGYPPGSRSTRTPVVPDVGRQHPRGPRVGWAQLAEQFRYAGVPDLEFHGSRIDAPS